MLLSDRFERAFIYANRLHASQLRNSTDVPYITHLMSVAGIVADFGGDEDQIIAGLLHDVVEDQGGAPRLAEIEAQFGSRVARMVSDCTDADVQPKPPWRERKERYIAHLAEALPESLLISAADKLHNARSIVADLRRQGPASFDKFTGGRDGTLWYYEAMVEGLSRRAPAALVDELRRTVSAMRELANPG